jgi:hypothetical protein
MPPPPVEGILIKCLNGFIVSELNSELEQVRRPDPWTVLQRKHINYLLSKRLLQTLCFERREIELIDDTVLIR